jgi:dipeptidyl aminopeptidase/acylaminoacyl peptidase
MSARARTLAALVLAGSAGTTGALVTPVTAPFGSWASPLSAESVASGGTRVDNVRVAAGRVYWTENRPAEGGRIALMERKPGGEVVEVTAKGANVRTRVHEYGGAPYVIAGGRVFYSQFNDQRLYEIADGGKRRAVTPPGYRYADCRPLGGEGRAPVLVCVREQEAAGGEVRNAIVRLDTAAGGPGEVVFGDSDFVAFPRPSPDGRHLAFIAWDHPNMPWDTTRLMVADLTANGIANLRTVAGGRDESILEPQWGEGGDLFFLSDRTDFWNLYRLKDGVVQAVTSRAAEFGAPLWTLGQANYALLDGGRALVRFGVAGRDRLAVLDIATGNLRELDLPYVRYGQLARFDGRHAVLLAGAVDGPRSVLKVDAGSGTVEVLRRAVSAAALERESLSVAEAIEYPSAAGRTSHAFYYAPRNAAYRAPAGTRPPLLAFVHGGPTGDATPEFSPAIQFWTTRGFAVVDVDYGGSAGFGRAYRQRLNGNWGVVDVEDVVAAVRFLTTSGRADPERTAISGGSAGGYTVLVALATTDVFRAGADYYGVSDMTALAKDTHKFESRYLDSLIGPLPAAQATYEARSPLNHLDGLRAPLIVFQGAEDPIVPPSQSERIVEALRRRKAPVAYLLFEGESHGFRRAENVIRSLQSELTFYGRVFGFEPSGGARDLVIENLPPP